MKRNVTESTPVPAYPRIYRVSPTINLIFKALGMVFLALAIVPLFSAFRSARNPGIAGEIFGSTLLVCMALFFSLSRKHGDHAV